MREDDEGSEDTTLDKALKAHIELVMRSVQVLVPNRILRPQTLRLLAQQHRRIRLGYEDQHGHPARHGEEERDPEHPAPAQVANVDEGAYKRADNGPEEDHCPEERERLPAVGWVGPEVEHHPAAILD